MNRFWTGKMGLMLGSTALLLAAVATMLVVAANASPAGAELASVNEAMEKMLSQSKATEPAKGKAAESGKPAQGGAASESGGKTNSSGAASEGSGTTPKGNGTVGGAEAGNGEATQGGGAEAGSGKSGSQGGASTPVGETGDGSAQQAVSGGMDLNRASEGELDGLPGIGPSKAKAIVAYRQEHGGFRSVEELLNVKGIGPKVLEKLHPLVYVKK